MTWTEIDWRDSRSPQKYQQYNLLKFHVFYIKNNDKKIILLLLLYFYYLQMDRKLHGEKWFITIDQSSSFDSSLFFLAVHLYSVMLLNIKLCLLFVCHWIDAVLVIE